MAKIGRHGTARKVVRRQSGKVQVPDCCCGAQPDDCAVQNVYAPPCGGNNFSPLTYKIVFEDVELCDCTAFQGSVKPTGTINRTYYITAGPYDPNGPWLPLSGTFFGGDRASVGGAYKETTHASGDCTGDVVATSDEFYIEMAVYGPGSGETGGFLNVFAGFGLPFSSNFVTFENNACFEENTVENNPPFETELGPCPDGGNVTGTGGTATITPCPPCAMECGGGCVVAESSGTNCDDFFLGDGPDGQFNFEAFLPWGVNFGRSGNIEQPAGCVWLYKRVYAYDDPEGVDDHTQTFRLYVWFDGQDWRGTITLQFTDDEFNVGPERAYWTSMEAGDIACTNGSLAGTMTLEAINGFDCDIALTFNDECGGCPTGNDCSTCCASYTFVWDDFLNSDLLAQSGTTCTWTGTGTMYHDGSKWIYEGTAPGAAGAFRYEAECDGDCPPTNAGAWSRVIGDPAYFNNPPKDVQTTDCPP